METMSTQSRYRNWGKKTIDAIDRMPATIPSHPAQLGQTPTNTTRATGPIRVLQRMWKEVAAKERELLAGVTFADLVEQLKGAPEGMYHI